MQIRKYPSVHADVEQLQRELCSFFENAEFKEVRVRNEPQSTIVEANKISRARECTGLAYSLTIKITPTPEGVEVAIGRQRWVDKVIVGILGAFLTYFMLCLGAASAAIGAYNQYRLTENAWDVVENHMSYASKGNVFTLEPGKCVKCGKEPSMSDRFCPNCGAAVKPSAH